MAKNLAVIFDLDGTLVNTEIIHAEAESRLLKDFGFKMTPEEISRTYAGIPTEKYIEKIANYAKPVSDLMSRKGQIIDDLLNEQGIRPIQGMPELVHRLNDLNIPIGIASSSGLEWIQRCLHAQYQIDGITHSYARCFANNFVSCSEVAHAKPAPDVLLEAKKRMEHSYGLATDDDRQWVVVGDSQADMECALSANMTTCILGKFDIEPARNNVYFFSTVVQLSEFLNKILPRVRDKST